MNSKPSNKARSAWAVAALALATLAPARAQLACQLGVLDLSANGGINPATGVAWVAGDTYRLVFVTSANTTCESKDITTYNSFVQGLAAASTSYPKLGNGLWKVVGSTSTVDARDNTKTNPSVNGVGETVFRMDGNFVIANNYADLWDGINSSHVAGGNYLGVHLDQNGNARLSERVRTGSGANGTAAGDGRVLGGSGENPPRVQTGRNYAPDFYGGLGSGNWMQDWSENAASAGPVFALSGVLTVVDTSDTTVPTLVSIADDTIDGKIVVPAAVVYTVTFDQPMSAGTVDVTDFENDPTLNTSVTITSVEPTANPAVFKVTVGTTVGGALKLQIKAQAVLADLVGNLLNTTSALPDDATITVIADATLPTLVSISDNAAGAPIVATRWSTPIYTVTFDEAIDPATVGTDDFENGSSAPLTIQSVNSTANPAVFQVVVTTSGPGELVLQIKAGAVIKDLAGNPLKTTSVLPDDTTVIVNPAPDLAGELGVFDVVNANGGINPATGVAWAAGDTYRLIFVTSADTACVSTDIGTYNAFVQGLADAAGLGSVTWKVVGSTATVAAKDNTNTNPDEDGVGEPILRMDGTFVIANSYADLWDGINSSHVAGANFLGIHLDENGVERLGERVRTGSGANGTAPGDGRVFGGSGENPPRVQTGRNYAPNFYGGLGSGAWMQDWSEEAASPGPVYALSEPLMLVPGAAAPQITSFTSIGGGVWELSLLGNPNTPYEFRSSTTLDFTPGTLVESLTQVGPGLVTAGKLVTTDANGDATVRLTLTGDPADFVRAQTLPPPLSENFDAAAILPAGWVGTSSNGTAWQVGAPSGVTSGPTAATSPPNCAGTNISGYYTENADATLTSPTLTIPAGSGATLSFQQFIDTDLAGSPHDLGSVRILDADNADAPIAGLEITGIEGDGLAGWTKQTLALPIGDVGGKNIKVQFRFVSNAGTAPDNDVWSGFYIDDVIVTIP